ncbi:MAG: hypothetical protein RXR06_06360 [Thermoproteus sp.]
MGMRSTNRSNRRGISNVVVIVIIIIIAVAAAVAVWVFGRVGAAAKSSTVAKSSTLQLQSVSLTGVSSGTSATLTLVVSNPSSSNIMWFIGLAVAYSGGRSILKRYLTQGQAGQS